MLNGDTVTLEEMLECRERRAYIQQQFLTKYACVIISFCLNIPGPVKTNPEIRKVFLDGQAQIKQTLKALNRTILDAVTFHEKTGDEWILCLDGDPKLLKQHMTIIEETHPLGRLFDIDVLDANGIKISRTHYRKCLICDLQAQECARMRRHTVAEMQTAITEMISGIIE